LGSLGEAVKESKDKDRGRERPPKTRFEEAVEILKMLLRQEKITKAEYKGGAKLLREDEQDAIYFCTSDECMQLEYLQVDHQFD
jgi:rubrerythrin